MTARFRTLEGLNRGVTACRRCPRLVEHRERIARVKKREFMDWRYWGKPVPGFGDPRARFLIVGLAPGAHGSNRTGRMFTGDSSGVWLYDALHRFGFASQAESVASNDGLKLTDCYITAAVRCAPPGNKPTAREFDRCRSFLNADLQLLPNVRVTLTLGRLAHEWWLKAAGWWDSLAPADRPQFSHGRIAQLADGSSLVTSYHPSRQNTNTGRLTRDMWYDVFRLVRRILEERRDK
ncbi:MAG: uracil-DNA glycosylase [Gemmatimonadales bacterium]